jgi:hypothetical protein
MLDLSDPIDTILVLAISYFIYKNFDYKTLNNSINICLYIILIYLIIKKICNENFEFFTSKKIPPFDSENTQEKYKVIPLSHLLERPTANQMKNWIDTGYFLDDGNEGYASMLHNKCSPLCCKKQKFIPNDLQPDPNMDLELARNIDNYETTNITCMDLSNISDSLGNASCMCLPKQQTNLLSNRGYSKEYCNKK